MRKEDIAILDRMASSGKKHLDKNLKRLKHTHTHTHTKSGRVLMAEGTVDAKSLTWIYILWQM